MTGPGRSGRDEQASLTAQLCWDYSRLLLETLSIAMSLRDMYEIKP
jgi:hypothetical protein